MPFSSFVLSSRSCFRVVVHVQSWRDFHPQSRQTFTGAPHLDTTSGAPASRTAPFAEDRHKCRAGGRRSACHATSLGAVSRCAQPSRNELSGSVIAALRDHGSGQSGSFRRRLVILCAKEQEWNRRRALEINARCTPYWSSVMDASFAEAAFDPTTSARKRHSDFGSIDC